ncbi:hypothetical protein T12_13117, partial [Trichinella patagoniensis]
MYNPRAIILSRSCADDNDTCLINNLSTAGGTLLYARNFTLAWGPTTSVSATANECPLGSLISDILKRLRFGLHSCFYGINNILINNTYYVQLDQLETFMFPGSKAFLSGNIIHRWDEHIVMPVSLVSLKKN